VLKSVGALVAKALFAYTAFGAAMAVLALPAFRAFEHGSIISGVLIAAGLIGIYALAGGALCVSFISQLRNWPPPGPNCAIDGRHFVRTWPWTAASILTELGMREVRRG